MVRETLDTIELRQNRTMWRFCSFYTKSDPILDYMIAKLNVENADRILEPCAGDGEFVKKILERNIYKLFTIDAVDLNEKAIEKLRKTFSNESNINIRKADTLLDESFDLYAGMGGYYNKIIGNPPYGAFQDLEKRKYLKKKYSGYVRETYTLFLKRCISLLTQDGRLVFIIPDTFLALHLHKGIREYILNETNIEEILLIPTRFFPEVDFGYSNLCIITINKSPVNRLNDIRIVSVDSSVEILSELAEGNYKNVKYIRNVSQETILQSKDSSFFIGSNNKLRDLINHHHLFLEDIADCVTGFYSGNNKQFVFTKNHKLKGSKKHSLINEALVDYKQNLDLINGLKGKYKYIPYLKGGSNSFTKPTEWFISWDKKSVDFYKTDKKARFQNSKYYFKQGIGIPMVKSKKLKAFLLNNRLFDQSIVGVFPKEDKYLYFLLGFLNSDVCSTIVHSINHTANNSANYLKKIPIIYSDTDSKIIEEAIQNYIRESKSLEGTLHIINGIINKLYKDKV